MEDTTWAIPLNYPTNLCNSPSIYCLPRALNSPPCDSWANWHYSSIEKKLLLGAFLSKYTVQKCSMGGSLYCTSVEKPRFLYKIINVEIIFLCLLKNYFFARCRTRPGRDRSHYRRGLVSLAFLLRLGSIGSIGIYVPPPPTCIPLPLHAQGSCTHTTTHMKNHNYS